MPGHYFGWMSEQEPRLLQKSPDFLGLCAFVPSPRQDSSKRVEQLWNTGTVG
jgi:hypothetical protein